MTPPAELAWVIDGEAMRLTLAPGEHQRDDDAVGLLLLPVLLVLVVVSVASLLAVLGLALSGRDPALHLGAARPGFLLLGAVTWVGSAAWYRLAPRHRLAQVECTLEPGAVCLGPAGAPLDWRVALVELERAEVRGPVVRLVAIGDETREIPVRDEAARAWLAAEVNQRIGALKSGLGRTDPPVLPSQE